VHIDKRDTSAASLAIVFCVVGGRGRRCKLNIRTRVQLWLCPINHQARCHRLVPAFVFRGRFENFLGTRQNLSDRDRYSNYCRNNKKENNNNNTTFQNVIPPLRTTDSDILFEKYTWHTIYRQICFVAENVLYNGSIWKTSRFENTRKFQRIYQ